MIRDWCTGCAFAFGWIWGRPAGCNKLGGCQAQVASCVRAVSGKLAAFPPVLPACPQQENEQGRARQLVQESLAAQRQWLEQQQAAVGQQLHAAADRLTAVEQRVAAVEQEAVDVRQGRAGLEAQLAECCSRFAALEEQAQQAAEAGAGSQEQAAVQEARLDSLWQRVEQGERDWRQLAQVCAPAGRDSVVGQ